MMYGRLPLRTVLTYHSWWIYQFRQFLDFGKRMNTSEIAASFGPGYLAKGWKKRL